MFFIATKIDVWVFTICIQILDYDVKKFDKLKLIKTLSRITLSVSPYKNNDWNSVKDQDVAVAALLNSATYYDYTPIVGSGDTADAEDEYFVRTTTRKINNIIVSKSFNVYKTVAGERVEISQRATTQNATFDSSATAPYTTITTYYAGGNAATSASAGKVKNVQLSDGRLTSYSYEYVAYAPGTRGFAIPDTGVGGCTYTSVV